MRVNVLNSTNKKWLEEQLMNFAKELHDPKTDHKVPKELKAKVKEFSSRII